MEPPLLPSDLSDLSLLVELRDMLLELREIVTDFSKGNFSRSIRAKGSIAGGLKGLQADLKHLTWQVKQVEKGDFTQRVTFMGEFSEAFNSMTVQLESSIRLLEDKEARFRHMACHDALTGVFNRAFFMMEGEKLLRAASAANEPFGLILVDLDKFKAINDTYGHPAGDAVLRHVVMVFQESLRDNDPIYRYGGEEFVVVLKSTTLSGAHAAAERMRCAVECAPMLWENTPLSVTASFGVSVTDPGSGYDYPFGFVVKMADDNMYTAKHSGRNRVVCSLCPCPPQRRQGDQEQEINGSRAPFPAGPEANAG